MMSYNYNIINILQFITSVLTPVTAFPYYDENSFKVYWNIPSFMCKQYNTPIWNVTGQYGIIQNYNDDFIGDQVAILYDPGLFPAILQNSSSKKFILRNGGVPQEGNLFEHLQYFENHVNELIPDRGFSGIAIIDFESWRPIFRQNFGSLQPYKNLSLSIEKQKHPFWGDARIEREARNRFEVYGRRFMEQTLWLAQKLRPRASWGYYAFPYCFNGKTSNTETCPSHVSKENNGIQWLFDSSDIVFPSVYMTEKMPAEYRLPMVRGRIAETMRLIRRIKDDLKPKVFVYYRYVYTDTLSYLSESDAYSILQTIKQSGADAVVLWGSSNDLNTREKCTNFYNYLVNTLGPVVHSLRQAYYVKSSNSDNS